MSVDWNNRPYPRAFGEWDVATDQWTGWVELGPDERVELGTFEHVSELQVALDKWDYERNRNAVGANK